MTDKDNQSELAEQEEAIEVEAQDYIEAKATKSSYSSVATHDKTESGKTKTTLLWMFTLVNLLLLIAAGAGGYWFFEQWQADKQLQNDFFAQQSASLASQSQANTQIQQALQQQQSSVSSQLKAMQDELARTQTQALSNSQNLADISGRRPSDWLLAEADYLVRMAGRKLWLEHDVKTAVLMLQSADSRLQDLADPSLITLRQYISTDIQTLQQINNISLTSIALSLSGMLPQIDKLALALPKVEIEQQATQELSGLDRFWDYLKSNFRYQPNDQPLAPLLSTQQQWLVKEQLRYALMHAQSAVLDEQAALYQQSLQRALSILIHNFDLNNESVAQFVDALNNLQQTNIERTFPDQLRSAQPLKDLIDKRLKQVFSNTEVSPL